MNPRPPSTTARSLAPVLLVPLLLVAAALAFVLPWLPPPPVRASLARYAPAQDGAAWLAVTLDPDGSPERWTSATQKLVPHTRALASSLRAAQSTALATFYGAPGEPADLDTTRARLVADGAEIYRTDERELALGGVLTDTVTIGLRAPGGDFVLGLYQPHAGQDLIFEPALRALPPDLVPGETWEARGTVGGQIEYRFSGVVQEQSAYHGQAGSFADCVRIETRLVLSQNDTTLDDVTARTWHCAAVGSVETERIAPDGALTTRTVLLSSSLLPGGPGGTLPPPPPAASNSGEPRQPADPAAWQLTRMGRALPAFDSGSATFAPVWLPTNPPLVLAAAYDGALTAYDARDPSAAPRWRFGSGGTFFGQPAYDPASGRIFVGASDKRLYALDTRGMYLWSFAAGDNIATRPAVAGNVVIFGGEDRAVYGLDVASGRMAWKRPFETGGPVVSSPVVAGDVVLIGADDGQVYGLDPASGEERWSPFAAEDAIEAPLVLADDTVYVASRDGQVYGLDPASGEETWRARAGNPLRTAPAVGAERAFVVDELGILKALELASGRRLWLSDQGFVGPPLLVGPQQQPALVVAREDGAIVLMNLDGVVLREWRVGEVASPVEDAPGLAFGPTAGDGALWLADDNAVVLRLGAPLDGPRALQPAWYRDVAAAPFAGAEGAGLYYSAAAYQGRAVVLDSAGNVYLVDPADGRAERLGHYEGEQGLPTYAPDPVVAGDTLLISAGGTLGAMDLRDGRVLWRFDPGAGRAMQPPVVAGDTVLWLAGTTEGTGTLYALELDAGAVRWQAALEGFMAAGGVLVDSDRVYTSTPPAAFDLASGRELWRNETLGAGLGGGVLGTGGDTLFVAVLSDPEGSVAALDSGSGQVRWQATLDTALSFADRLWFEAGTLVVPAYDGQVLGLDPADGRERWRAEGRRWGNAGVIEGRVWQIHDDGRVSAIDTRDGTVTHYYSALEPNLELIGVAGGRPVVVGTRVILPYSSALLAFEVP
jgi:outer membrane protein assembly factor BamB